MFASFAFNFVQNMQTSHDTQNDLTVILTFLTSLWHFARFSIAKCTLFGFILHMIDIALELLKKPKLNQINQLEIGGKTLNWNKSLNFIFFYYFFTYPYSIPCVWFRSYILMWCNRIRSYVSLKCVKMNKKVLATKWSHWEVF